MTQNDLQLVRDETGPHAGIATLFLDGGDAPVVVLNEALLVRLNRALDRLARDITGLVLASTSRVFVAGADLKAITTLDDALLDRYLSFGSSVFMRLCDLPVPTVAAINGAALGGGLELAMHCDGLVGAPGTKPYPVGLPEASLRICPGWGGTNLLPARIDPATAIVQTASGTTMQFDQAVELGLFDATATSQEDLLETAKSWIAERRAGGFKRNDSDPSRWIGRPEVRGGVEQAIDDVQDELPATESASATLAAIRAGLGSGYRSALETERAELIRLRHTAPAEEAIRAFFDRSKKS